MPRGVHDEPTGPIQIHLLSTEHRESDRRAELESNAVSDELGEQLDRGYDVDNLEFAQPHVKGPVLWEMQRDEGSKAFVEACLIISGLINSHHNVSYVMSETSGEAVMEYTASYIEKEGNGLVAASAVMLAAIDHIHAHPSVADNTGTDVRTGQHFATRVVNSLTAATEFSVPIMLLALRGRTSIVTSEAYWYLFPHDNVTYVERLRSAARGDEESEGGVGTEQDEASGESTSECETEDEGVRDEVENRPSDAEIAFAEKTVDEVAATEEEKLMDMLHDMGNSTNNAEASTTGGTNEYKLLDGTIVYVSQAESHLHRGPNFVDYNPQEFHCIVDLKKRPTEEQLAKGKAFILLKCRVFCDIFIYLFLIEPGVVVA
jgi:hypothetical protein